jgi:hypothetical protein
MEVTLDSLIVKAEQEARAAGRTDWRLAGQVSVGKKLAGDYDLLAHLMKRDAAEAVHVRKQAQQAQGRAEPDSTTTAEDIAHARAIMLMKRDGGLGYELAKARVYLSDPTLQESYERERASLPAEEVMKRLSVERKARDRNDDADDECDPDDPECEPDDDLEEKRKRRLAARRGKHDYGPDDEELFTSGDDKPQASHSTAKRAKCPNCWNQVDVDVVRKRRSCPSCSKELTVV